MIRSWVYDKDGKAHERVQEVSQHHFVQPDITEHGGRAKWREHLKRNGSIEMSPKDMLKAQEKWNSKKADFHNKLQSQSKYVQPSDHSVIESKPYERTLLNKELANRLDGRPTPDRKTLIKLVLENQRMLGRR